MLWQYQWENLFKTKLSSDILPWVSTDLTEYFFDIVEGTTAKSCFVSLDFGNTGNSEVIEVHRTAMDWTRLYYYQYNREFPDRTHEVNSFCQINSVAQYVNTIMNNIDTFWRTRKMVNPGLKVRVYGGIVEDLWIQNIVVVDQVMDMVAWDNYIYYDYVNNVFAKIDIIPTEFDVVSKVTVVWTDITVVEDLRAIKVRLKNWTVLSKLSEVLGKLQYDWSNVWTTGLTGTTGRWIVDIQKTQTVGLVDTYTVTFSDATSMSFDVTNWAGDMNSSMYDPTGRQQDVFAYIDGLVSGVFNYRTVFDASAGTWPTTGWSWTAWAIKKWDCWKISVAGTLGWNPIQVGDMIIANSTTPGQTNSKWDTLNTNITYVPAPESRTITINGITFDLSANRTYALADNDQSILWAQIFS